jgi:sugar/nucleoside kinase (ribokinase family)
MSRHTPSESIDYLVIGHVAKDLTPEGPATGGTVSYAGLTARALGLQVGVATSAGQDVDLTPLAGLQIFNTQADHTTTFENHYTPQGRQQRLLARAADLNASSIPASWRNAPIVHLGPIAREVDASVAGQFPTAFLGLTPQGWMRTWDENGWIRRGPWEDEAFLLPQATAVVVSLEDVMGDEKYIRSLAQRCQLLAVTMGALGARVYWQNQMRHFPAAAVPEIDPTGSGDIFAACFFIRFHQTHDPWEAAQFANRIAAPSVTRRGLQGIPSAQDVERAGVQTMP